jgi:hypothetical protein
MPNITIDQMPKRDFSGEDVDNCFFVKDPYSPVYAVPLGQIFGYIEQSLKEVKDAAENSAVTIEFTDNKIVITKK